MRELLLFLAIAFAGYTGYEYFFDTTPYSSYSASQLDQLSLAYAGIPLKGKAERATADVARTQIEHERERRHDYRLSSAVAAVFLLGGLAWPRIVSELARSRRRTPKDVEGERLLEALGNPARADEARRRAAALLGIEVDAPPHMVESAFQHQLTIRELHRLDTVPVELRRSAMTQYEALDKARALLLQPPGPA